MAKSRFTKNAVVCEIQGASVATDVRMLPQWVTALTEGLYRFAYRGTTRKVMQWVLPFHDLSAGDRALLESFFCDTAKGPQEVFTYRHTDGVSYTDCRFVTTALEWTRDNANTWSTTVTIEFAGTVNP